MGRCVYFQCNDCQKQDLIDQIRKRNGVENWLPLVALSNLCSDEALSAGADYMILDEGEITLPMFVEAVQRGDKVEFSAGSKTDVTTTQCRFDLLELDAMIPCQCSFPGVVLSSAKFCDIIVLYGRKPRTKTPRNCSSRVGLPLSTGMAARVFMVDDNFIGNKAEWLLLQELKNLDGGTQISLQY